MQGSAALYAAQLAASASGWLLARRRPAHLPLAAALTAGLVLDLALELRPPFALAAALGTAYPWLTVSACRCALLDARRGEAWLSAAPWAALLAAALLSGLRGPPLAALWQAEQALAALALGWAALRWWLPRRRGPGAPSASEAVAVLLAAAELAVAAGGYLELPAGWDRARAAYLLCYGACAAVQGGALCMPSSGSSSGGPRC